MEAVLNLPPLATLVVWGRTRERETPAQVASAAELELVRLARGGDRNAFARIVELHKRSVHALASRLVGAADAADVAQDAFLRAYQRLPSFDARRSLRPWLLAIAHHRCVDELRRRRRAGAELTDDGDGAPQPPPKHEHEHEFEVRQELARVHSLLRELPAQQREALLLFHQEGLSYRDIAGVMGAPMGTVMTWIHRARHTLRERLRQGPEQEP